MRPHAFFGFVLAAAIVASCREPTTILLQISTDVDCATVQKQKVVLRIGTRDAIKAGQGQTTEATTCDANGDVGTLTVIPSGDESSPVVISVVLGTVGASAACTPGAPGCIVASRSIGYVGHTTLKLPIKLTKSCIGVPCGFDQTCVAGTCVSNEVRACPNDVCDEGSLSPVDAGVDAPVDAGTLCNGVSVDLSSDPVHCGACNFDCTGSKTCVNGVCILGIGNADPLGEIAIDATQVVWTGGATPVSRVPKNGGTPTAIFTPTGGDTVFGLDYSKATNDFRFADNVPSNKVAFYGWSGTTATPFLSSNGTADARELIADGTSVIWRDALSGSLRRDSTLIAIASNPPVLHIAVTKSYFVALAASGVFWTPRGQSSPTLTVLNAGAWIAGDPSSDAVYVSTTSGIAKANSIALDAFKTLVPTPAPGRIFYDAIKSRIIWVGNGNTILEADASGTNVRTDLAASQGFGPIGDLVADDGAVYFLSKGLPHKVARK